MDDLRRLVLELAAARAEADAAAQRVAEIESQYREYYEARAAAKARVMDIEAEIRGRTYSADERTPAPGLTVKVVTQLDYSESAAREWAIANGHWALLLLDRKAFEKAAVALKPDFVRITRVPTVSIARDLSDAWATIHERLEVEAEVNARLEAARETGEDAELDAGVRAYDLSWEA